MEMLATHLALHGVLVLLVGLVGGLFLYRSLTGSKRSHGWHLLHAGVTSRGVLLIALSSVIELPALPAWHISAIAWLIILFAWASTLAMTIGAFTGERGFGWTGSSANKLSYTLYALGALAVFPACALLAFGLFRTLLNAT